MAELFENLPFENLYWNQMETVSQEELREIQVKRLRRTVERVKDLPLYQSFFKENPLTDDDFQVPEDAQRLRPAPAAGRRRGNGFRPPR